MPSGLCGATSSVPPAVKARVCRVELIDEEPESAGAAGPVPDIVASGDEHEQKEVVMTGLPEDE